MNDTTQAAPKDTSNKATVRFSISDDDKHAEVLPVGDSDSAPLASFSLAKLTGAVKARVISAGWRALVGPLLRGLTPEASVTMLNEFWQRISSGELPAEFISDTSGRGRIPEIVYGFAGLYITAKGMQPEAALAAARENISTRQQSMDADAWKAWTKKVQSTPDWISGKATWARSQETASEAPAENLADLL